MNFDPPKTILQDLFSSILNIPVSSVRISAIGGGSINDTHKVTVNGDIPFFVKINSASRFPHLFEKEKRGLEFLQFQKLIRIPEVVDCAEKNGQQLLVLEWIDQGNKTEKFWKTFGEQLAYLHQTTNENFGFAEDNYMGALPQLNTFCTTWTDFFIQYRLLPQVELAARNNLISQTTISAFSYLYTKLDTIFNVEKPSLLHGDLWSGNFLCDKNENPVLIDPAVYFGNRNVDMAMTTLFGGFDKAFYESYQYHFPLSSNYKDQWQVCNLYPLLIHLNLFGISYLQDIELILKKFAG